MRFQSVTLSAVAAFSAIACAQDAAQLSAYESDVAAYITATLVFQSGFESFLGEVQTNTAEAAAIEALTSNFAAVTNTAQLSSLVAGLPSDAQPFFTSVIGVVSGIAVKNGVLTADGSAATTAASASGSAATASSTASSTSSSTKSSSSSAGAAQATGNGATKFSMEMGVMGGALMGVVGLMVAL